MTAQKSWWCLLVLATGISTALLNPTQVNASPDLKDGIKLYQSKNYQAASVIFAAQHWIYRINGWTKSIAKLKRNAAKS